MASSAGRQGLSERPGVLIAVRYGIPVALVLAAVVAFLIGGYTGFHAGILFLGSAGVVLLANVLFRMGTSGERDRHEEDAARRFFDEHGYWPDERAG